MKARVYGASSGPGLVRSECCLCGWRHRSWGLSGKSRWARGRAAMDAHLADAHPKPRWVDLFGIDPDFTDGQDVNEFLDESRGEA